MTLFTFSAMSHSEVVRLLKTVKYPNLNWYQEKLEIHHVNLTPNNAYIILHEQLKRESCAPYLIALYLPTLSFTPNKIRNLLRICVMDDHIAYFKMLYEWYNGTDFNLNSIKELAKKQKAIHILKYIESLQE